MTATRVDIKMSAFSMFSRFSEELVDLSSILREKLLSSLNTSKSIITSRVFQISSPSRVT